MEAAASSAADQGAASSAAPSEPLMKPLIVGSCAFSLGKRAEESKSHEWVVYVRAQDPEEDLSQYIKKVVFQLHQSFKPATRVIEQPPFEVTEQGWGEFEVHIQVFFHATNEKHLDLAHMLRLYADASVTQAPPPPVVDPNDPQEPSPPPVVSERYEEVLFQDPSEELRGRLTTAGDATKGWKNNKHAKWYKTFDPDAQVESLKKIYENITAEISNASKKRVQLEEALKKMRSEMAQQQQ